ncbi:sphingomyelin phosphodiesterase [Crepidotus variabilis]|uniref:Sphingomyelin phosphodiesterase n=1 Tax=Crepidotus variabilis TaxID=179855 RepID=A0A9P6EJT9_9AGAR|nr:sphingomyelin phosphodiesterase [Crepidotus variabilis]
MKALPVVTWLLTLSVAVIASFVDDILQAIENAVDCGSCHTLLAALEPVVFLGDDVFVDVLVGVCKATKVEDADVCEGTIKEQAPIIAHDLRETSAFGKTGTRICNALLGLCQQPDVTTYKVPILKTQPATPKAWHSTGKTPFQVVHFSDVHIDRSYQAGTDANCSKPICCRPYVDHKGPVQRPAGPSGSHGCDTPSSLAQSMLSAVKGQNTKFSVFTGDVVEAAVWLVDPNEVTSDLQQFNKELATLLNSPVYPAIVAPINAFPRNTSTDAPSAQWVFDTQAAGWTPWIGGPAADSVKHMSGSYSSVVQGTSLKILSLNTMYWYRQNYWLYDSDDAQPDPNGILSFASRELEAAEDAGQRVWIIAHMPPSSADAIYDQSNYFDQLVQRYKNTISAQFYGHSHVDEFAIAYSDYTKQSADTATSIAYIAPSLTPRSANPAFRVYDVDPDTYEIMDSRTFITSSISNINPSTQIFPASWKQEYSARDTYGPAIGGWPASQSLTPAFWHKVTEAFVSNDPIFQKYNALKTRNYKVAACTGDCKNQTICAQRALRAENGCHIATPGFHWRRAEGEVVDPHLDHCEGTGLADIFWKVSTKVVSVTDAFFNAV